MYDGDRLVSPGRADFRRASISSDDILVVRDGGEASFHLQHMQQLVCQRFGIDTLELYMIFTRFSSQVNTVDREFSLPCLSVASPEKLAEVYENGLPAPLKALLL